MAELWRLERAAQRLDYSGISDAESEKTESDREADKSSQFFDYEELGELEGEGEAENGESEERAEPKAEDGVGRGTTSTEHHTQRKRNRKDDMWWEARRDLVAEVDSVDADIEVAGRDRPVDAVKRSGAGSTPVAGKRLRLARGITIDSGAADNVMPRRFLRGKDAVRPSPASVAGVHYVVANDGRIPNEVEAEFEFQTKDGQQMSWLLQIAEVNETLASVSALVDSGHVVTFNRDDATGIDTSFITHKESGRSTRMRRERNVWVIDAYLEDDMGRNADSLFSRQE